jgi:hypothetical protein
MENPLIYTGAAPESSVVQCGQRVALIGIDIVQAGQSFATGGAVGDGRFILFTALTSRKMQKATMTKLMINVTKFP